MYVEISSKGIKITTTDVIGFSKPIDVSPIKDGSGNVSYYQRLANTDQRAEHWLQRLGAALANYLREYSNIVISKENEVLVDFPEGYVLYQHNKEYKGSTKTRHDRYLFGAYKFRSPKEFEPHLIWLVSGRVNSCECLYCGSGSKGYNKGKRGELTEEKIINTRSKKKLRDEIETNGMETENINKPKFAKTLYRRGEVVMVNLNATGNEQHIKLIRYASDDNDIPILYWPGVILETRKVPITDNISDDTTSINSDDYNVVYKAYYKIHLLELSDIVQVDRKSLLPWLVCRVEIPEGFNKNEELEPNVKTYVRAIDRVNKISHTYTPVCSYKHKEAKDSSEKLRLQKYNAILLGTEMIYRNDYIRLTPVDVNEKYNNGQKVPEYLLISNIYQHSTKGIQFTGAGLLRGMLYKGHSKKRTLSDYEWITVNEPDSEYTIDLQDIAGRFYVLFPNLMEKIDWTSPKKLDERFIILGVKWK